MISSFLKDLLSATNAVINKSQEDKLLQQEVPETDIYIHNGDDVKILNPDFLINVYPEKLNKFTVSKGLIFRYHFLSKSLHFWIELVQTEAPNPDKISKNNVQLIKNILNNQQNFFFKLWAKYLQNKEQFEQRRSQESAFVPPGQSLRVFEKGGKKFQLVYVQGNSKQLYEYRIRFQFFLVMFIDGVSSVNSYEDTWGYYIIYELDQSNQRHFAGLLSKYTFKITHAKQRQRISQVLVLPCYQNMGLAKQMLDQFYNDSIAKPSCFEITVEGPSHEFQCLRTFKQAQLIIKGGYFNTQKINNFPIKTAQDIKQLKQLYLSNDNVTKIKQQLKLPGLQIDAIANILIFIRVLDSGDEMLRANFDEFLRLKFLGQLAAFKDRDIAPCLFIDGKPVDTKNYLILKNKQQFLLRTGGEVEELLRQSLQIYQRVVAKLRKLNMVGTDRVKNISKEQQQTEAVQTS